MMAARLVWHGEKIRRQIRGEFAGRVREALNLLARAVRFECPVDSGALSSTIRTEDGGGSLSGEVVVGDDTRGVNYAPFVEFGTSRQAPNPFFRRAINSTARQIQAVMARPMSLGERAGATLRRLFR